MPLSISSIGNIQGELYALAAAFIWALASLLFNVLGKSIRPIELNLIKGIGGFLLFAVTSLVIGDRFWAIPLMAFLALVLSGVVGIGFGDTVFFEALNRLGARRALLIVILAPPLTVLFAWLFLGEVLSLRMWAGILITILGVAWVITEKESNTPGPHRLDWLGVFFGFLAALSQAAGAVLSRWALTATPVSALGSAVIRLLAGTAVLFLWVILGKHRLGGWLKPRPAALVWVMIAAVIVFGTYIAIWFQQLSFKYSDVGIAQTLLATSPLFIIPIAALQKEKVSLRSILGALVSVAGIALIFWAV